MALIEEKLTYTIDGVEMHSTFYADDAVTEKRPGVLVFPDARGLDHVSYGGARRLAEEGFPALACDFYGGGRYIESTDEAIPLATKLARNADLMAQHGREAIAALSARPEVDASRIAAIGYCFGGNVSVEIARSGLPLLAAVGFHGGAVAPDPARSKTITGKILLLLGACDPMIPIPMRNAFEEDMRAANVDFRMHIYGRVYHAFTNPKAETVGLPDAVIYDAAADARSWVEMKAMLAEVFG